MYFDGSVCGDGCGIGVLLVSPRGVAYSFSFRLPTTCTNNLAEYEAVHKGMKASGGRSRSSRSLQGLKIGNLPTHRRIQV
jgi:ribonuclease HI